MLGNKELKKTKDKYLLAFFLIYMVVLLCITFFRSTFSLHHVMGNGLINLSLFQDYFPLIRQGRWFLVLYLFGATLSGLFHWEACFWHPVR